jgi:ribosomal protein S18 acetylase RimI-like enzyme
MTATFRQASPQDAAVIDRIFRTSFCDTFAHLYRDEDLSAFLAQFTSAAWQAELADPNFAFQIAEAGEPAGYVKLGPLKLPVETDAPALELKQLYVLKAHHGAGIARQLMEWAFTEARRRGAAELYLTVYTDNHRARRFYDRYGFGEVGRYAFMVGNHADEDIIMRKAVTPANP